MNDSHTTSSGSVGIYVSLPCIIAILFIVGLIFFAVDNSKNNSHNNNSYLDRHDASVVPFILWRPPEKDWQITLYKIQKEYEEQYRICLAGISRMVDVALEREERYFRRHNNCKRATVISRSLKDRIGRLSTLYDQQQETVQSLLSPPTHHVTLALAPSDTDTAVNDHHNDNDSAVQEKGVPQKQGQSSTQPPPRANKNKKNAVPQEFAYTSFAHILAHMVRDWSDEGEILQRHWYGWCRSRLRQKEEQPKPIFANSNAAGIVQRKQLKILVPGAGLGRLAYDLAIHDGNIVEANELSFSMVAVAHQIFNHFPSVPPKLLTNHHRNNKKGEATTTKSIIVYPFLTDFFIHEVDHNDRYDAVVIESPLQTVSTSPNRNNDSSGRLSYTVGDFMEIYGGKVPHLFDAVVTCFFLDTATNVLDYIAIISNILPVGGKWVNLGPLQWHANTVLHLSAKELREVLETSFGFRILEWSIDDQALDYRMQERNNHRSSTKTFRSTKVEAYRVLRFVAVKASSGINYDIPQQQQQDRDHSSTTATDAKSGDSDDNGSIKNWYHSSVTIEEL